jgi:DNA-binding MarR family transcriptional regulator
MADEKQFELADRVVLSAIRLVRALKGSRRSADLTEPEISALAVLTYGGAMPARDLAAHEGVTAATISRLVSAMEAKGLVRRAADKTDARVQWISISPSGVRRVRDGHVRRVDPLAAALARLPREKRETLAAAAAILDEAVANILREAEGS